MNAESIEAKYVFPLEDSAAVCGFEAFIGDKHIVGTVKEKAQAHKEYKEAIGKGHGAYLMDEEAPVSHQSIFLFLFVNWQLSWFSFDTIFSIKTACSKHERFHVPYMYHRFSLHFK